jgi:hypothetical protein
MYTDENELTHDELAALAALPREMQPSDLLEQRVVHALKIDGHFGGKRGVRESKGIMLAVRIAAGIALFAGGVATGRYLLASDSPQSASTVQPSNTILRDRDTVQPDINRRQVKQNNERIVAEREMWL